MRKIGWLARQHIAMGPQDSLPFVFSPDLTTRLTNWLFCFNAVFPAPPVAAPRGGEAAQKKVRADVALIALLARFQLFRPRAVHRAGMDLKVLSAF